MDWTTFLTHTELISAILVSFFTVIGFLYGGWRMIIKPLREGVKIVKEINLKTNENTKKIDEEILPTIVSIKKEFSTNSGKTIKDQLFRIEEKSYLADARIRLIATNLVSTGIFESDPTGECIWVNRALSDLFGLDRGEMLGNGWLSAIDDDDRKRVWDEWQYCIQHKIPYEDEYSVCNRKTNQCYSCRVISMTVKNSHDQIMGYFGTVTRLAD